MIRNFLSLFIFILFIYLVVFSNALRQDEDHLSILFHIPQVLITDKVAKLYNGKYLAKNNTLFIDKMSKDGFTFVEQIGAGYIFTKNEQRYISTSNMYSSYFMIFTEPDVY